MTMPTPPLAPMLARLERELPQEGSLRFEPKWDGFRCLVFCSGGSVDMRSRNNKELARYFPELVEAWCSVGRDCVVDGEIVVPAGKRFDFQALLQRLHPAVSRVEALSKETPALLVAFDLIGLDGQDLAADPFVRRRRALEDLLEGAPPRICLTPSTDESAIAREWLASAGDGGIDGVMVKEDSLPYLPGKRRMIKVKNDRTADCVVGGFRWHHKEPTVGSLLMGLYDGPVLRHAGLASSFGARQRRDLLDVVKPFVADIEEHPWREGFNIDGGPVGRLPGAASRWADGGEITWIPLRPALVAEASYDQLEGQRFRHPLRFKRWRLDRDPRSCTYEQFPLRTTSAITGPGLL